MYEDGDITSTPVSSPDTNRCPCGYKHWYKSNEYDNPPQEVSIKKLQFNYMNFLFYYSTSCKIGL